MKTFEEMEYHPTAEELVKILCDKTQNTNPLFFRVLVGYYFCLVASMMRATIVTHDRGEIPVNMYALNLAVSGAGKGHATNIMENEVIHQFRSRFLEETFISLADQNLPKLAVKRANRKGEDPDDERVRVQKEFDSSGPMLFSFSEATPPAVKQLRHKMLMADAGALNLQVDEIGSNLVGAVDVLNTFLELYDQGMTKTKLVKNTTDSIRGEEIVGKTPTNLLMFGTPSKLLNGGKTEEELNSMLDTGYGRRCFFGYSSTTTRNLDQTPEEVYNQLTQTNSGTFLQDLADQLDALADGINVNKKLKVSKETSLLLIEYRIKCEREAAEYPDHETIRKAELAHRYFKALKLAGAYAFIDDADEVTTDHLYQAIKLAEESGAAFNLLLTRDQPYVKLAKYISSVNRELTQADLVEALPFYKGPKSDKEYMLTLAIAYGYKNNIIIKKSFSDGIEFLRGESLKESNIDQMVVSYSSDWTTGYLNERVPFHSLHQLTQVPDMHWVAHHLNTEPGKPELGGYRKEENVIGGFNLAVLDVDGGVNISTVKLLLSKYKYLIYTTKSHTEQEHCFRIILPLNYELNLDAKDYKEFMTNIYDWLPFEVDTATKDRARKWASHDGFFEYNDGEVFDALPFIPKTSKNEARKELLNSQQSMDNLERWVTNHIGDGNRNNMLLRYAMILVDAGFSFDNISQKVVSLNDKIADKLSEVELQTTILRTVMTAIAKKP